MIKDKESFINNAVHFLDRMFNTSLQNNMGDIEIRTFTGGYISQNFFNNSSEAAQLGYNLCNQGIDVYFGVNPRMGKQGKKLNVHYVTTFHAEIDYGEDLHKKKPKYKDYREACLAIKSFELIPTLINTSGGGFHLYWVLNTPVKVVDVGVAKLETINKHLGELLGGDSGTHNIDRVLRIPGTYNYKNKETPRLVDIFSKDGPKYDFEQFKKFMQIDIGSTSKRGENKSPAIKNKNQPVIISDNAKILIDKLPVSDNIKNLIQHGNDGSYVSRSEADMAVITALIHKGFSDSDIKGIFNRCKIGEKYREHQFSENYLNTTIQKAKSLSNLTNEERENPLFFSGAIAKDKNNRYNLNRWHKNCPYKIY